ncbi:hypothetical protein LBMAG48_26970 [Phycisphaerae bacterium]|nr:hypothetical protein LBMAG48_26970 [Phycisphaerae bacterium]
MEPVTTVIVSSLASTILPTTLQGLFELANRRREERQQAFFNSVAARVQGLELKCEPAALEGAIVAAMRASEHDARHDKTAIFSNILKGAYVGELDGISSRLFVSLTDRLEVVHLHVLRALSEMDGAAQEDKQSDNGAGYQHIFEVVKRVPDLGISELADLTTMVLYDLVTAGLVHARSGKQGALLRGIPSFVQLLREQTFSLSPLGRRYVRYVQLASDRAPLAQGV